MKATTKLRRLSCAASAVALLVGFGILSAPAAAQDLRDRDADRAEKARQTRERPQVDETERARRIREAREASRTRRDPRKAPEQTWIAFEPAVVDFGYVSRLSTQTATVNIKNIHDAAIELEEPKASCSCTVPRIEKLILEPGESVEMDVAMNIGYAHAKLNKSVRIMVKDQAGSYTLPVRAESCYKVRTEPSYIRGTRGRGPSAMAGRIRLEAVDDRPFHVLGVDGEPPVILTQDPPAGSSPDGSTAYTVEYALDTENPPAFLLIETDHPEAPVIDIKVATTEVLTEERKWRGKTIKVTTPSVNMGAVKPGETKEVAVIAKRISRTPEAPVDVRLDHEGLSAEFVEVKTVDGYKGQPEQHIIIRVTNKGAHEGVILAPLLLGEPGRELDTRVWLAGRAEPGEQQPGG